MKKLEINITREYNRINIIILYYFRTNILYLKKLNNTLAIS